MVEIQAYCFVSFLFRLIEEYLIWMCFFFRFERTLGTLKARQLLFFEDHFVHVSRTVTTLVSRETLIQIYVGAIWSNHVSKCSVIPRNNGWLVPCFSPHDYKERPVCLFLHAHFTVEEWHSFESCPCCSTASWRMQMLNGENWFV